MVTGPTNANKHISVSYIMNTVCLLNVSPTHVAIPKEMRLICYSETFNYLLSLRDVCYLGYTHIGKGKAIPLQAWTGPEASRRLRLPDFKTIGT